MALFLVPLSCWLLYRGDEEYLGDSGMRILWQLIQGLLAGVILLVGCILVFKQRAGITLLHAGIGLLMFGQFFVTQHDVEEQVRLSEGQTVNYGQDIRCVELAVVNRNDPDHPDEDTVVVIPLSRNAKPSKFQVEKHIFHDLLPFDIEILQYFRNSRCRNILPDEENLATNGSGLRLVAEERKSVGGAEGSEINLASAYVKLAKKNGGKDLGTYLLSQEIGNSESVEVGNESYDLSLRFERNYKPYSMHLVDVRKDDYVGTTTPRNYSSDVRLVDTERNVDRMIHIWMNNPLRYSGETFYQSGYAQDPSTGREVTTLQVVKNAGWMIPYVACMLVGTGMMAHFLGTLLRFSRRRAKAAKRSPAGVVDYAVPAVLVALAVIWLASRFLSGAANSGDIPLEGFGRLPLADAGRVKPFDTLARNSLVLVSDRSTFRDAKGDKQPAIRWLLDVITHSPEAERHRVFRVDNLDVLGTLGLRRRKGSRYSLSEMESHMGEFRRQVELANSVEVEQLSVYQKKTLELDKRLQVYYKLHAAFRMPDPNLAGSGHNGQLLLAMVNVNRQLKAESIPRAIPTTREEDSWMSFVEAATTLWIQQLARAEGITDPAGLAKHLADPLTTEESIQTLIRLGIVADIEEFVRANNQGSTEEEVRATAEQLFDRMDAGVRQRFVDRERELVTDRLTQLPREIEQAIVEALGDQELHGPENQTARSMTDLFVAYRNGDATTFNKNLERLDEELHTNPPAEYKADVAAFEVFFNRTSPFFLSLLIYLLAFVVTALAWLGWRRPLNRAALSLVVVAFVIHTLALLARIYISGRPPVTNLYSSAVFIGWGCVVLGILLELIFRLGVGNIIATVAGFATLVIAHYLSFGGDTITVLQAVLDTQFWLATHVVCITLGYSTTYVAGLLGILYILGGVFSPSLSPQLRQDVSRMTYGILCFSIFFSFVGTVLGGLWADDSWGRFWGWDPKENGALIIVLWNALVIHARWGAMIKQRGLAVLATAGNIAVSWSWFGVNELGVGLHSYGFTEGVLRTLAIAIAIHFGIIALGLIPTSKWWSYRRFADA